MASEMQQAILEIWKRSRCGHSNTIFHQGELRKEYHADDIRRAAGESLPAWIERGCDEILLTWYGAGGPL